MKNEELLEIWDWEKGKPSGKSISRTESHKNGMPHEAVHLWIVQRHKNTLNILFQHRSKDKSTYPDYLDITVGGHVPFGLSEGKIQKEAEEEIGIDPDTSDLINLGYYRYIEKNDLFYHREFQEVYILIDNRPLDAYTFKDGEVIGLYAIPLIVLERFFEEDYSCKVSGYDGKKIIERSIGRKDIHPQLFDISMELYMKVILEAFNHIRENKPITAIFSK